MAATRELSLRSHSIAHGASGHSMSARIVTLTFKTREEKVMLPKEKPCDKCIHKGVCEAKNKYEEIDIKITHKFFEAKITCSQFVEERPSVYPRNPQVR